MAQKKLLLLFDVDGTLTEPRGAATEEVKNFMIGLREKVTVGVVGGSDLAKQQEQLSTSVWAQLHYSFPENGLVAFKEGVKFHEESLKDYLGEERLKQLINFLLHAIADIDIPIKRGTFIEFRSGMLNVSPIGRNCSQAERIAFEAYDNEHKIRENLIKKLQERFANFNLAYLIGGQISMDIFPLGWDKTYCLRHVESESFDEIHFFGDKTEPGGNDHAIYTSPKVIGHRVTSPQDTMTQVNELLQKTFGN